MLREIGQISNFIYRLITQVDPLAASQRLKHLRDLGLIEQQGKGASTYYTVNPRYLGTETANLVSSSSDNDSNLVSRDDYLNLMPQDLRTVIENLGERADRKKMMKLIIDLCSWRELSSSEIASILVRNQSYIVEDYLNPLIHSGGLEYTNAQNPNDPNQTYRSRQQS